MDDPISRQTAIEALWKALYAYEDKTEKQFQESDELDVGDWIEHRIFVQNMSDIDRQTILALPSAQPENLACGEGELNVSGTNVGDMISRQALMWLFDWWEHEYDEIEHYIRNMRQDALTLPTITAEPVDLEALSQALTDEVIAVHERIGYEKGRADGYAEALEAEPTHKKYVPSAQPEPLTDKEQRIFLAAMGREMKVCEETDRNYVREPYEDSLVSVCKEIERKVKGALWT